MPAKRRRRKPRFKSPRIMRVVAGPKVSALLGLRRAVDAQAAAMSRAQQTIDAFLGTVAPDSAIAKALDATAFAIRGTGSPVGDAVATILAMNNLLVLHRDAAIEKRRTGRPAAAIEIETLQKMTAELRSQLEQARRDADTYRAMLNSGSA